MLPIAAAQPEYQKTIIVKGGGTPAENGQALMDAVNYAGDRFNNHNEQNWLIEIEPGVFDTSASGTAIELPPSVSLAGSGMGVTTITWSNDKIGINITESYIRASIRDLTIEGHTANNFAINIIENAGFEIRNTEIINRQYVLYVQGTEDTDTVSDDAVHVIASTFRATNPAAASDIDIVRVSNYSRATIQSSRLLGTETADGVIFLDDNAAIFLHDNYIEDDSTGVFTAGSSNAECRSNATSVTHHGTVCP